MEYMYLIHHYIITSIIHLSMLLAGVQAHHEAKPQDTNVCALTHSLIASLLELLYGDLDGNLQHSMLAINE